MTTKTQAMEKRQEEPRTLRYDVGGQEVALSEKVIRDLLVKGDKSKVTGVEVWQFALMCQHQKLDPFVGDAYLVKYGNDAQMLTSKGAFMKRAESCQAYRGFEAGLTIELNGELVQRAGALVPPGGKLVGAWARVYRSDRDHPAYSEISASEYNKGRSTWKDIPATMLRKVAIVHAMREAFPAQLGGLYSEEELVTSGATDRAGNSGNAASVEERLKAVKRAKPEPVQDAEFDESVPCNAVLSAATERFGAEHIEAISVDLGGDDPDTLEAALKQALTYESDPPSPGSIEWEIYIDSLRPQAEGDDK
jgi:phage recombination protein Bet